MASFSMGFHSFSTATRGSPKLTWTMWSLYCGETAWSSGASAYLIPTSMTRSSYRKKKTQLQWKVTELTETRHHLKCISGHHYYFISKLYISIYSILFYWSKNKYHSDSDVILLKNQDNTSPLICTYSYFLYLLQCAFGTGRVIWGHFWVHVLQRHSLTKQKNN